MSNPTDALYRVRRVALDQQAQAPVVLLESLFGPEAGEVTYAPLAAFSEENAQAQFTLVMPAATGAAAALLKSADVSVRAVDALTRRLEQAALPLHSLAWLDAQVEAAAKVGTQLTAGQVLALAAVALVGGNPSHDAAAAMLNWMSYLAATEGAALDDQEVQTARACLPGLLHPQECGEGAQPLMLRDLAWAGWAASLPGFKALLQLDAQEQLPYLSESGRATFEQVRLTRFLRWAHEPRMLPTLPHLEAGMRSNVEWLRVSFLATRAKG